ncbi:hypothetical protein [Spiribacter onubensis]|uniref:DUF2271 domain-containing protein n=1 Tax=Spiribacter onubensis TaxID=3122420 RepID=A0ABV3S6Y9_9GAMM
MMVLSRSLKSVIQGVAIVAVLFSAMGLAAAESEPEWLFVHTADVAEIRDGSLLAVPMGRDVFAFTDRPYREHRYLNAHEFVALWDGGKNSFHDDPPNAVMTWMADGEVVEAEVELVNAVVADYGRRIIYEFELLSDTTVPETMHHVSLFVDMR